MSKIRVVGYEPGKKPEWNTFVAHSKNGIFLFDRAYLEYHVDRFPDASLMFYGENDQLLAVLPATFRDTTLSSHAGLTFGGILSNSRMKASLMLEIFDAMCLSLIERGLTRLSYKAIPHIYHRLPAEEDLYALFRFDAQLVRRDISSTIMLDRKLPFSKGRKWALKQGKRNAIEVRRSYDFSSFMAIEHELLQEKYDVRPVHSSPELTALAQHFPDNIKLFGAYADTNMLGGVIIYETDTVAHAQYIAANSEGKQKGALDLILNYLINDYYRTKKYFDFGISTENGGYYLNANLIENKQSFGARAIVYDLYEIDLLGFHALSG